LNIDWKTIRKLGEVQQKSNKSLAEMVAFVKESMHQEPYTIDEIANLLKVNDETITKDYLGAIRNDKFELYKRSLHVYSEAERVYSFNTIAKCAPYKDQLEQLGDLMNRSQSSCSNMYNCSCEELDKLCQICISCGALGSRLTGAGWGGCTISLVPTEKLESFILEVRQQYYSNILKLKGEKLVDKDILFSTSPGGGALFHIEKI